MMINPDSIAFDFDGVLADTMTLFLDIARKDYQVQNLRYEDITCYMLKDCLEMDADLIETIIQRIQDGSYTVPLKPMAGAVEVLTRLEKFSSPILFVTARPYTGPILDWIQSILPVECRGDKGDTQRDHLTPKRKFCGTTGLLILSRTAWRPVFS